MGTSQARFQFRCKKSNSLPMPKTQNSWSNALRSRDNGRHANRAAKEVRRSCRNRGRGGLRAICEVRQDRETDEPDGWRCLARGELTYRTAKSVVPHKRGRLLSGEPSPDQRVGRSCNRGPARGTAVDLYAGGGLFSSVLAGKFAQVIAVEPSQISYPDLLHNSPSNVKAVRATSDQYLQKAGRLVPDFLVVDPPRADWEPA